MVGGYFGNICLKIWIFIGKFETPPGENVIDLAFAVQHLDNGLEKDIGAMFIRFGNNTKVGRNPLCGW